MHSSQTVKTMRKFRMTRTLRQPRQSSRFLLNGSELELGITQDGIYFVLDEFSESLITDT